MDLYRTTEAWSRLAVVSKVWGYEVWHFNTDELCMKTLVIYPGHACSIHGHKKKYEIFTCLDSSPEGQLILTLSDREKHMQRGDHVVIERGQLHTFRCEGLRPAALLEFSTHHREDDSYRVNVSHRFAGGDKMDFLGKVSDFKDKKVLCVGDICLDVYEEGTVERLSPEAPCPVLLNSERSISPGCVGNVAVNIASLGGSVKVVAVSGKDGAGSILTDELKDVGVDYHTISVDSRPTSCKTRYVVGNYNLLRVDQEEQSDIGGNLADLVCDKAIALMQDWYPDVLYMADYDKGVLSPDVITRLIMAAHDEGVGVIADPKRRHFTEYKDVDVLKPNEKIAGTIMGLPVKTTTDIVSLCHRIVEDLNCDNVLLTRGGKGMYLHRKRETSGVHIPARYVEVSELSGAGDTAGAALALGLASGWTIQDAAMVANVAASLVVQKSGTASCTPSELAEALSPDGAGR